MGEEMKPGRELDALVAEKVMGYKVTHNTYEMPPLRGIFTVKNYTTDITAAWEVVTFLREKGLLLDWILSPGGYGLRFVRPAEAETTEVWAVQFVYLPFEQTDFCICLAALKTVGL